MKDKRNKLFKRETVLYNSLKKRLSKRHKGKFIVIEPESGEYFIGQDAIEVMIQAKKRHPQKPLFLEKIGYPAAFSLKDGREARGVSGANNIHGKRKN